MNVVNDYLDILQNIEAAIIALYNGQPDLRDPDVILALEKVISQYTREKKKLPALPLKLPEKSRLVFQAISAFCEMRLDRASQDIVPDEEFGYRLPLRLMIPCLERLHKSANTWHKRDGQRGYLSFVSRYV